MNRDGHLAMAAVSAATVSFQLEQPLWQRAASVVVALATASAPDVDNTRWWQEIRQHFPVKGLRPIFNHRGITHSWLIPLLAWKAQPDQSWLFTALIVGYASHLVADFLFGKTGVPVLLWRGHAGLRLPMGAGLEKTTAVAVTLYTPFVVAFGPWSALRAVEWVFSLWN